MKHETIRAAFEDFLERKKLRLTRQREQVFELAFEVHDHFTAETFLGWLNEREAGVSRATVYRTLGLLVEGGFLELLDVGSGEAHYEHVLGHQHHDHLICTGCGRIEEFREPRIEALQEEVAAKFGFSLDDHDLWLMGLCKSCQRKRA